MFLMTASLRLVIPGLTAHHVSCWRGCGGSFCRMGSGIDIWYPPMESLRVEWPLGQPWRDGTYAPYPRRHGSTPLPNAFAVSGRCGCGNAGQPRVGVVGITLQASLTMDFGRRLDGTVPAKQAGRRLGASRLRLRGLRPTAGQVFFLLEGWCECPIYARITDVMYSVTQPSPCVPCFPLPSCVD